jgi:carbon storage regulator CsrA
MLVLRRTCGQSVTIGKNAETIVKVLGCENGIVSLGFDAAKDVQVDRLEVFEKRLLNLPPEDNTRSILIKRLRVFVNKVLNVQVST